MNGKRNIDIYSAGCFVCEELIKKVADHACPRCEIAIRDVRESSNRERAIKLGIRSIPAVVIDDTLAACCTGRGADIDVLKSLGLGVPR